MCVVLYMYIFITENNIRNECLSFRMPPALLAVFAEVILLQNGKSATSDGHVEFPSTRPMQQNLTNDIKKWTTRDTRRKTLLGNMQLANAHKT